MAQKLKFGNGTWATKKGSTLAYNDENNNYKPLPFTTTRNSIGTRVNKEGLIEVVGNDVPRIDYKDSSDGALLLENSSTNLIPYSEDFSNAAWDLFRISVTTENYASPNGSSTVKNIIADTSNNTHGIFDFVSASSGIYTSSAFFKANGYNFACVRISVDGDTKRFSAVIDLTNGNVTITDATGSPTSTSFSVNDYGNGWYRLSVSCSHSSGSVYLTISPSSTSNPTFSSSLPSFLGDGTSGVLVFGAQLEQGSYATSYIPTSGSTVQRAADTASGAGNSEVFNSEQGILFANIAALANDLTNRTIALSDGTTSNTVRIQYLTISNAIWATVTNIGAGGNQAILQYTSSDITINSKISLKYKANDFSLWVNGFEVATDTSGVTFSANTLNTFQFDRGNGAEDFYGKTKELGYYDTALTDEELEYMTSYRSLNELVTVLNLNKL